MRAEERVQRTADGVGYDCAFEDQIEDLRSEADQAIALLRDFPKPSEKMLTRIEPVKQDHEKEAQEYCAALDRWHKRRRKYLEGGDE